MYWICVFAVIMELVFRAQNHNFKPEVDSRQKISLNLRKGSENQAVVGTRSGKKWKTVTAKERLSSGAIFLVRNSKDGSFLTFSAEQGGDDCTYGLTEVTTIPNSDPETDWFRYEDDSRRRFKSQLWVVIKRGRTSFLEPGQLNSSDTWLWKGKPIKLEKMSDVQPSLQLNQGKEADESQLPNLNEFITQAPEITTDVLNIVPPAGDLQESTSTEYPTYQLPSPNEFPAQGEFSSYSLEAPPTAQNLPTPENRDIYGTTTEKSLPDNNSRIEYFPQPIMGYPEQPPAQNYYSDLVGRIADVSDEPPSTTLATTITTRKRKKIFSKNTAAKKKTTSRKTTVASISGFEDEDDEDGDGEERGEGASRRGDDEEDSRRGDEDREFRSRDEYDERIYRKHHKRRHRRHDNIHARARLFNAYAGQRVRRSDFGPCPLKEMKITWKTKWGIVRMNRDAITEALYQIRDLRGYCLQTGGLLSGESERSGDASKCSWTFIPLTVPVPS